MRLSCIRGIIVICSLTGAMVATQAVVHACVPAPLGRGTSIPVAVPLPTATATLPTAFAAADAVFRGEVVQVDSRSSAGYNFGVWQRATLSVDAVWKGTVARRAEIVVTGEGLSDCDLAAGRRPEYGFRQGMTYIVYARMGQYGLTATAGTKLGTGAQEEAVFGTGTILSAPTSPVSATGVPASSPPPTPLATPLAASAPNAEHRSAALPLVAAGGIVAAASASLMVIALRGRRSGRSR